MVSKKLGCQCKIVQFYSKITVFVYNYDRMLTEGYERNHFLKAATITKLKLQLGTQTYQCWQLFWFHFTMASSVSLQQVYKKKFD